ncbi:LysR family transcriptional regulator [Pelagibius sp.]|uniref:LysR family transcriptional regulator n=1 Tax=Pelagibius sp. TaxID=1931238 RepID=UPI003BB0335F
MDRSQPNWDDLRVFLALVETGSLSAAARRLGMSQPTVGRRIQALEETLDKRLFDRLPKGYLPTAAAEALLPMAASMGAAAEAIDRSRAVSEELSGTVRISAGSSACRFLCNRMTLLLDGLPGLELELAASFEFTNLSRREADIALRNRLPEQGDLVTQRVARPAVAVYGSRHYVAGREIDLEPDRYAEWDWVGYDEAHQHLATARWLSAKLKGGRQRVRCSTPPEKLYAVKGGAGLGLLSCYAADSEPDLVRVGDPIPELQGETWMVVHQDMRQTARIRAVVDRLLKLFRDHRPLFDGERPIS